MLASTHPRCCAYVSLGGRRRRRPPSGRPHSAPDVPREFFDLPCQIAHRPKPHPRLFRVKTVPVISVALALRAASAGRTSVHPAPRPAVKRRG